MTHIDKDILFYVDSNPYHEEEFSHDEKHILEQINKKVAAAKSLEGLMEFLFSSTHNIFPCDRIGLAFLDDDKERVIAHWAGADYSPLYLKTGYSESVELSSLKTVFEKGKPRIINDLQKYLELRPNSLSTKLLIKEGVRSSLTCPLFVDGRIVGVMFRSARTANMYNMHHVYLHKEISERISQAIEKAYLIEKLTRANKSYFELLGFISHELKSPVSSIIMNNDIIIDGYLGPVPEKIREAVASNTNKANYLLGLIEEYLNLSKIENDKFEIKQVEHVNFISEILDESINILKEKLQEKKIKLIKNYNKHKDIFANLDPTLLKIVMVNLLDNAIKYNFDSDGEITITIERREKSLFVSVKNNGYGFPEEQKDNLFKKFSRLQVPDLLKKKGTGIGLYTCWRIINLHKGVIRANSEQQKWAEFWFKIPQPFIKGDN